jgi:hypothetical protein
MCTLYKGKPFGLAHIQHTDTDEKTKYLSFEGLGIFYQGNLHMGPATFIRGDGWGLSLSRMIDGRPADNYYHTKFKPEDSNLNQQSVNADSNV